MDGNKLHTNAQIRDCIHREKLTNRFRILRVRFSGRGYKSAWLRAFGESLSNRLLDPVPNRVLV